MDSKRGQSGVEYLIIVGFVTFAVLFIFSIAIVYSNSINDNLRINQMENFANQLISSSESVFFAGEPSQIVIKLYLPKNVEELQISGNEIVFTIETSNGLNTRSYRSKVPLDGSITNSPGEKKLLLKATNDAVEISNYS